MIEKLYEIQEWVLNIVINYIKTNPTIAIQVLLILIALVTTISIGISINGSSKR